MSAMHQGLYDAAMAGNQAWLATDGLNSEPEVRASVMCQLAAEGQEYAVEVLLKSLGNSLLKARDADGCTPFLLAVQEGHFALARKLLDLGADVHEASSSGCTAFHLVAMTSKTPSSAVMLSDLLSRGSAKDLLHPENSERNTPLHLAAFNGDVQMMQQMLSALIAADVLEPGINSKNAAGNTPLHCAARMGNDLVVKSLMEAGANALLVNGKGQLALGVADEIKERGDSKTKIHSRNVAKEIVSGIFATKNVIGELLWVKNSGNDATLLHYFAGYGKPEELEWMLSVICNSEQKDINRRDANGFNAVHWAALKGNKAVIVVLAKNGAELNAHSKEDRTPVAVAFISGHIEFAEELLEYNERGEDWLWDVSTWIQSYVVSEMQTDMYVADRVADLRTSFDKHTKPSIFPQHATKPFGLEIPPIYLALHLGKLPIALLLQRHSKKAGGAVNEKGIATGRTALHWATLLQERKIVSNLCGMPEFKQALAADVEDKLGKTALQYAKEMGFREIEKELLQRSDVIAYVDALYRDRQVYVDAANAILVGSALISGVTFAGWLQPPLSYMSYYDYPIPNPTGDPVYQSFAGVKQHVGVRMFWIFNSLSFSFGIASMIACLVGVVPVPQSYIATTVQHLRRCLLTGASLLGLSIVFVLAAFAAAGFVVLPPRLRYEAYMAATTIVGGMPCAVLLAWFARRLWSIRPRWLKNFEKQVLGEPLCTPHPPVILRDSSQRGHPASLPSQKVPWDNGLDASVGVKVPLQMLTHMPQPN